MRRLLLVPLLLMGCETEANLEAELDRWKGQPATALVRQQGQPDAIKSLPNGHIVYRYRYSDEIAYFGMPSLQPRGAVGTGSDRVDAAKATRRIVPAEQLPIYAGTRYCDVNFTAGADGLIQVANHRGNHCKN